MWWSVSAAARYWSSTVWWAASVMRLLPPIATTTRRCSVLRVRVSVMSGAHIVSAITAFWTWSRFSAWSYTALWGPSITSSVTSMLRSAGSGCM